MGKTLRVAALAGFLVAASLGAIEPPTWGAQVGLTLPVGSDLTVTTASGLNPTLGLSADWSWLQGQTLRSRLDLSWFGRGRQLSSNGVLQQELLTKVKSAGFGADYLVQVPTLGERWSLGLGLGLIRWTVDSTNRLEQSNGSFVPSGSSSWTRASLSLVGTYRWNARLESELRIVSSQYGYEKLPTRTASVNVLWHF